MWATALLEITAPVPNPNLAGAADHCAAREHQVGRVDQGRVEDDVARQRSHD